MISAFCTNFPGEIQNPLNLSNPTAIFQESNLKQVDQGTFRDFFWAPFPKKKKKKKKKTIGFYPWDLFNKPQIPDFSLKKAAQTFSVHFFTMNSSIRSPNVPIFLSETSKSNPLNPSTPLPLISKISQMAAKNPGIGLSVTLPRSMQYRSRSHKRSDQ